MLTRIGEYLIGQISFKAEGGLCEKLLNRCMQSCIALGDVVAKADGFTATARRRDFAKIQGFAAKTRTKLMVLHSSGIYYSLLPYRARYGIMIGIALAMSVFFISPHLIWSIRFYDFTPVQKEDMRRLLYDNGVYEGTFVHQNLLSDAKKNILISSDDYGWVALNFAQGRLVVEKTDIVKRDAAIFASNENIVADCDGIVRRIDLSGGFLQVSEGQSVAKGDLLVSSTRPTATGGIISTEVSAKIFAEIEKTYEYAQKFNYTIVSPTSDKTSRYALRFCGKDISLFKAEAVAPSCQERLLRYPLSVCGFALPCTVYEYEARQVRDTDITLSEEQALAIAKLRISDAIAQDLPEVSILSTEEDSKIEGNSLIYRVKIRAQANIAKNVQANR